jgi:hypothetical protein
MKAALCVEAALYEMEAEELGCSGGGVDEEEAAEGELKAGAGTAAARPYD